MSPLTFFHRPIARRLAGYLAPLIMGGIWWMSDRTWSDAESHLPGGFGNLLHILTFGSLSLTIGLAAARPPRTAPIFGTMIAAFWGLVDEAHQHFVPGRSCSTFDLLVDLSAAAAAGNILSGFDAEGRLKKSALIAAIVCLLLGCVGALWLGDVFPKVDLALARVIDDARRR